MRRESGFSLIELLIVVAIILVIAAMSVPNLVKSRLSANEASAVSAMRTINTAQTTYSVSYPNIGYADNLAKLGSPVGGNPVSPNAAGLLDWVLGCAAQPCTKSGYKFAIINTVGVPISGYETTGVPVNVGTTGIRGFCGGTQSTIGVDPNGGSNCTTTLQ